MGSFMKEPIRFDFRPLGASVVIFTPDYKIAWGNLSEGYEVNHSLNYYYLFFVFFSSLESV